jgi:hypothetical protein
VVATLALFLALGGGAVWAAGKITSSQIGKGAVKNKNLAKNAVKAKNIAKNAVTGAKLAKGAVTNAKLADGAVGFSKLAAGTNVIASATAGPVAVNQAGPHDLPMSNPITLTPTAGQLLSISIEGRATLTQTGASSCNVVVLPVVNGNPRLIGELLVMTSTDIPPNPIFPNGSPTGSITFPVGLTQPGQPQSLTLKLIGDADCTEASKIDQVAVIATQAK